MKASSPEGCILVVGGGPTGLSLAAQLRALGAPFRIIDRSTDRAHESRALAVQARTLELLDGIGVADSLIACGRPGVRLVFHLDGRRVAATTLAESGATDTRYPFILFVSQAETERILVQHLSDHGATVERGVELIGLEARDRFVDCRLRHADGHDEQLRASYVVGCDGSHSAVRAGAGFSFHGGSYRESFMLGDVEADGPLEPGAVHSFAGNGIAMFFPLGSGVSWRVIAMDTGALGAEDGTTQDVSPTSPLALEDLQRAVAGPTGGSVVVRDPVWLSRFRLHHRQVDHYRRNRVFLAGDAAHIHSPVGAQGMNTGIQDARNLGWKLAFVVRGMASNDLLESYEAERWPVGRRLLRYTDRVFSTFTGAVGPGRLASWARSAVAPRVLPRLLESRWLRRAAFRFVSELDIRYRHGPLAMEGHPRLRRGPRAGDRLPDATVIVNGRPTTLQRAVVGPCVSLLLCGTRVEWDAARLERLTELLPGLLRVFRISSAELPGVVVCDQALLDLLGVPDAAQYLIRPDGYIAFRTRGTHLEPVTRFLVRWFGGGEHANATRSGERSPAGHPGRLRADRLDLRRLGRADGDARPPPVPGPGDGQER